jgi:peptidoglycan/LPS O-acetylase OafA/YrhL
VPALAIFVAITAVLTCLVDLDPGESLMTGLTSLVGVSNIYLYSQAVDYFGSDALHNPFTHTWFLGVQEQFYLFFPAITWLALGIGRRADGSLNDRRYRWLLGITALASLLWFIHLGESDPDAAYYLTPGRIWELAAGALLFMVLHRPDRSRGDRLAGRLLRFTPPWASLSVLVWMQFLPKQDATTTTVITVLASCSLLAGLLRESRLKSVLETPWLRHIGLISYSLYLWHWSVLTLSRWTIGIHLWSVPIQLGLMLLLAQLSWSYVETPLRSHRWTRRPWQTLPVGIGVNGVVAGALGLLMLQGGAERLYTGKEPAGERDHQIPGTSVNRENCLVSKQRVIDEEEFPGHAEKCSTDGLRTGTAGPRRIFLVGDSHATSLLPMARELHERGFTITHLAHEGCPFPATAAEHSLPGCNGFHRGAEERILRQGRPGDVVIVAGYHLSHLGGPGTADRRNSFLDERGKPIRDPDRKLDLYADALARFGREASRRGLEVLFVGAGPRLIDRELCLPEWFRPEGVLSRCQRQFERDLDLAAKLNDDLRSRLPPITFIDPYDYLCAGQCSLETMRRWLEDDDHFSEAAALRLEQAILKRIPPPPS